MQDDSENKNKWDFFNFALDSERGVLRIGNQMFKLISYEGEATFDEYFVAEHFIASGGTVDNPEFAKVILDSEDKVLYGKYLDGSETDINLEGYTMVDPSTGKPIKLTQIVNKLK